MHTASHQSSVVAGATRGPCSPRQAVLRQGSGPQTRPRAGGGRKAGEGQGSFLKQGRAARLREAQALPPRGLPAPHFRGAQYVTEVATDWGPSAMRTPRTAGEMREGHPKAQEVR